MEIVEYTPVFGLWWWYLYTGGKSTYYKRNVEVLIGASKDIGNADKTKYMVMNGDQVLGRSQNMINDNRSFEWVEQLKYLWTALTSQNSIQEEINSRSNSGSVSYLQPAAYFVFQFAIHKFIYQDIQNCNFVCCFVWVWNLVADIEGGTQTEGVREWGVEGEYLSLGRKV
jgi:hypothetical protein